MIKERFLYVALCVSKFNIILQDLILVTASFLTRCSADCLERSSELANFLLNALRSPHSVSRTAALRALRMRGLLTEALPLALAVKAPHPVPTQHRRSLAAQHLPEVVKALRALLRDEDNDVSASKKNDLQNKRHHRRAAALAVRADIVAAVGIVGRAAVAVGDGSSVQLVLALLLLELLPMSGVVSSSEREKTSGGANRAALGSSGTNSPQVRASRLSEPRVYLQSRTAAEQGLLALARSSQSPLAALVLSRPALSQLLGTRIVTDQGALRRAARLAGLAPEELVLACIPATLPLVLSGSNTAEDPAAELDALLSKVGFGVLLVGPLPYCSGNERHYTCLERQLTYRISFTRRG